MKHGEQTSAVDALIAQLGRAGVRSMRPDLRRELAERLASERVTAAEVGALHDELVLVQGCAPALAAQRLGQVLGLGAPTLRAIIDDTVRCHGARATEQAADVPPPEPGSELRTPLETAARAGGGEALSDSEWRAHQLGKQVWHGMRFDGQPLSTLAAAHGVTIAQAQAAADAYAAWRAPKKEPEHG